MNTTDSIEYYKKRVFEIKKRICRMEIRSRFFGWTKLMIVITLIILVLSRSLTSLLFSLLTIALLLLFIFHEKALHRKDWNQRLLRVNEREIGLLEWQEPVAESFRTNVDPDHRFAGDLDIFTPTGLFHFINRASSIMGRSTLASWLADHATPEEIRERQDAVRELAALPDHRQTIQALGITNENDPGQESAARFLSPVQIVAKEFLLPHFLLICLSVFTLAAGTAIFFMPVFRIIFLCLFILNMGINFILFQRVERILKRGRGFHKVLKDYAAMFGEIESLTPDAPKLKRIRQSLFNTEERASSAIRRLAVLLEWMELRLSAMLHFPLNNLLFWDLHGARLLQNWQIQYQELIGTWMDALGQWEALCSLAALYANHNHWCFPDIDESPPRFLAENLGHPLIPENERVDCHVDVSRRGTIWIVTGSNMAGKSTFLRTLGVNIVLSLAGGPVCATRCVISPLRLYTSMRISDSLDKKLSLFYAELQRLKQVIDAVGRGETVFFLIDEMLKGTNTLDRQAGAMALIRQLHHGGAMGIVATHDLALAQLEKEFPDSLLNFHFDGTVEGEQLIFDYRLRDGACRNFNAIELMRRIGIEISSQSL